jgi:hypothetical protein
VAVYLEILLNVRGDDGSPLVDWTSPDYLAMSLEQLLAHFQAAGDFRRDSGSPVMALGIQGAIDRAPLRLARCTRSGRRRLRPGTSGAVWSSCRVQPERAEG